MVSVGNASPKIHYTCMYLYMESINRQLSHGKVSFEASCLQVRLGSLLLAEALALAACILFL